MDPTEKMTPYDILLGPVRANYFTLHTASGAVIKITSEKFLHRSENPDWLAHEGNQAVTIIIPDDANNGSEFHLDLAQREGDRIVFSCDNIGPRLEQIGNLYILKNPGRYNFTFYTPGRLRLSEIRNPLY